MKNTFRMLFGVTLLLLAGCSSDDGEGGANVGDISLIYGTWGITHMKTTVMGQTVEQDVDASLSTITFYENGTAKESQQGGYASSTWTWNSSKRIMHIKDSNFGTEYDWHVTTLTENTFEFKFSTTAEDIAMKIVATYKRTGNRTEIENGSAEEPAESFRPFIFRNL